MPRFAYVNGRYVRHAEAVVHVEDRGYQFADGVYEVCEVFERRYLDAQVSRFGGNISKTAAFIGMERSALHRKLRALGITSSDRADKVEI